MKCAKSVARAGLAASLLALGACGGGGSGDAGGGVTGSTSTGNTTQQACTQTPLLSGQGAITAQTIDAESLTTASTGRLDVTVDWTFPASPIGVYLVQANSCNLAAFNSNSCNFLMRSESGGKPRKVSVANLAAGSYDLLLANFAKQDESLSAHVVLSSTGCPALAGGSVGAAAVPAGREVVRVQRNGL